MRATYHDKVRHTQYARTIHSTDIKTKHKLVSLLMSYDMKAYEWREGSSYSTLDRCDPLLHTPTDFTMHYQHFPTTGQ